MSQRRHEMGLIRIHNLGDPRLQIYRDVRNRSLLVDTKRLIAEGWRVVDRLLDSSLTVESVLISERRIETLGTRFASRTDVFVLPQSEAEQLVGFNFHAGVLASAFRPANAPLSALSSEKRTIVCCPRLTGPDNLGSIVRLAAGFGAGGILLGSQSVDPYLRRVVRVSMGTIFHLPIRVASNWEGELSDLRERGYRFIAAELTENSQPLELRNEFHVKDPKVLMLGNEADGLGEPDLHFCDEVYHVEMAEGVDSLNVAQTAALFLYELRKATGPVNFS